MLNSPYPTDPAPALSRGLALFPLPAGSKVPAERGAWHGQCTADETEFRARWRPGENFLVGCRASNLFVIDLDGQVGIDTFAATCARARRPLPATLTVATPHGGLHLYFRPPPGVTLYSTSGGVSGLGPKIDTRAGGARLGGYVVGPGSAIDNVPYRVLDDQAPIAVLPDWLTIILGSAAQELHRRTTVRKVRRANG